MAVRASRDWGTVATQDHTGPVTFGQALARAGELIWVDEVAVPAGGMIGTGDRLAVEALGRLAEVVAAPEPDLIPRHP